MIRVARLTTFAAAVVAVVVLIGAGWTPHVKPDTDAYWLAGLRLREGLPLYAADYADEIDFYRYAPWFGYLWVPASLLPQELAYGAWRGLLLAGGAAATWSVLRWRTPAAFTLAVLMGGLMISALPAGNVTALMVGALAVGLPSRFGPVLLGIAGSLKGFPLLLAAGFLAERRWRDAALAIGVATLLWLPILLFDLSSYQTEFGGVSLYRLGPAVWLPALAIALALLGWLIMRGSRWTWLAAAGLIAIIVPRVWLPDIAYVIPGAVMLAAARRAQAVEADQQPG